MACRFVHAPSRIVKLRIHNRTGKHLLLQSVTVYRKVGQRVASCEQGFDLQLILNTPKLNTLFYLFEIVTLWRIGGDPGVGMVGTPRF